MQGNELSALGNTYKNKIASAQGINAVKEKASVWHRGRSINIYEIKKKLVNK